MSNSYLKKTIATIVAFAALGSSLQAEAAYASNGSTGDVIDEIIVEAWDNPYDVVNDAFDWTIEDYERWDVGLPDPDNNGASGGGDGLKCAQLLIDKPQNCPSPVAFPSGPDFGRDQFAGGSGIAKSLYYARDFSHAAPEARAIVLDALDLHTRWIAQQTTDLDFINQGLVMSIAEACSAQHSYDRQNNAPIVTVNNLTYGEDKCLEVLEVMVAELQDTGFVRWFNRWLNQNYIDTNDFGVPNTVNNVINSESSFTVKYNLVTATAVCASWWAQVQAQQCKI